MVDPKKEYDLLMRYLQGGALKQNPASLPEQNFQEEWQSLPQPVSASPGPLPYAEKLQPASGERKSKRSYQGWTGLKPISLTIRLRIFIAALAIFILLFVFWKGYLFYHQTPEKIFSDLYTPYVVPQTSQPPGNNSIEYYYSSGNYVAATLQSKKQKYFTDKENLLIGLSFLQRDDYTKAIKWLEPAANNFKSSYRQQAEYYLALTYLKNEDYDHAIEKMERIAYTASHPYHDRITNETIQNIKILKWR